MYGFKLKFRNVYTGKAFTKLYEIDTCSIELEDVKAFGFEYFDAFAWFQAVKAGLTMANDLEHRNDQSIVFEGVVLLYC